MINNDLIIIGRSNDKPKLKFSDKLNVNSGFKRNQRKFINLKHDSTYTLIV